MIVGGLHYYITMAKLPHKQLRRRQMVRELELKLLKLCEKILPNTRMANNRELKNLLEEIRNHLEGDK